MPSHQIRVQQNNCEHEWYMGISVMGEIYSWKCFKCNKIVHMPPKGKIISEIQVPNDY